MCEPHGVHDLMMIFEWLGVPSQDSNVPNVQQERLWEVSLVPQLGKPAPVSGSVTSDLPSTLSSLPLLTFPIPSPFLSSPQGTWKHLIAL